MDNNSQLDCFEMPILRRLVDQPPSERIWLQRISRRCLQRPLDNLRVFLAGKLSTEQSRRLFFFFGLDVCAAPQKKADDFGIVLL